MPGDLEAWIKVLSIAGTSIAFCFGVAQYFVTLHAQAETRRIEATRPFLDRQLKLYTDATQAVATLAVSEKEDELLAATNRFWSLYWGELALVEDDRVEAAMVMFGSALDSGSSGAELRVLSLKIAHACRESLADAWGVKQWRTVTSVDVQ